MNDEIQPGPHGVRPAHQANTDIASALLDGSFKLYRYDAVPYSFPVDWEADPFDNTWKWALHSFQYLYDAVHVGQLRKNPDLPKLCIRLLRDWWGSASKGTLDPYHWKGHTTGLRAQIIAYLYPFCSEDWYIQMMTRHGEELSKPERYEAVHNHGLDQDLGLLALGGALGRDIWVDLATTRAGQSAAAMVDRQGVSSEQAVGYTYYVYALLGKIADAIRLCGKPVPSSVLNRNAVPTFLAHATQPNGEYATLGDTPVCKAYDLVNTDAEYPASGGTRGVYPQDDVRMFDRGWIFGRTGWGLERAFADESFYSLRFGPGASVHGHTDGTSLTFYSKGKSLITEAGFGGYGDRDFYNYERSVFAHNTIVVDGYGPFITDRPTLLTSNTTAPTWNRHQLVGWPYVGVKRERTVVFFKSLEALMIRDRVWSANIAKVHQRWHLGTELHVTSATPATVSAVDQDITLDIRQLLSVSTVEVQRGQKNPLAGWIATAQGVRQPTNVVGFSVEDKGADFVSLITANKSLSANILDDGAGWELSGDGPGKYRISLDDVAALQVVAV